MEFDYRNSVRKDGSLIPPKDFSSFMVGKVVTVNKDMKNIIGLARRIAKSEAPVLISGASGVGKEVFAELVHSNSKRLNGPFIKLNCAAIPENLMESEFFGYEAGAFTGASKSGKKGVIELAEAGTLFLDEVGEMSLNMQAKLLRVLQDGKYLKVGGEKELKADIRIIAATNKNLEKMTLSGGFREDLYFRLNVIPIRLPLLKDRKEDIPILSLYFLDYFNKQYNMEKKLSLEVMEELIDYPWPGNVRELKNTIERLVLISLNDLITKNDLTYSNFVSEKYGFLEKKHADNPAYDGSLSLKEMVEEYEINIILQAVKRYGSIRKAARVLKVTPSTISRKLSEYNRKASGKKRPL